MGCAMPSIHACRSAIDLKKLRVQTSESRTTLDRAPRSRRYRECTPQRERRLREPRPLGGIPLPHDGPVAPSLQTHPRRLGKRGSAGEVCVGHRAVAKRAAPPALARLAALRLHPRCTPRGCGQPPPGGWARHGRRVPQIALVAPRPYPGLRPSVANRVTGSSALLSRRRCSGLIKPSAMACSTSAVRALK